MEIQKYSRAGSVVQPGLLELNCKSSQDSTQEFSRSLASSLMVLSHSCNSYVLHICFIGLFFFLLDFIRCFIYAAFIHDFCFFISSAYLQFAYLSHLVIHSILSFSICFQFKSHSIILIFPNFDPQNRHLIASAYSHFGRVSFPLLLSL